MYDHMDVWKLIRLDMSTYKDLKIVKQQRKCGGYIGLKKMCTLYKKRSVTYKNNNTVYKNKFVIREILIISE